MKESKVENNTGVQPYKILIPKKRTKSNGKYGEANQSNQIKQQNTISTSKELSESLYSISTEKGSIRGSSQ